jgi:murein DD-endopeptidase MepM/ murein hydrolase activator NlpD
MGQSGEPVLASEAGVVTFAGQSSGLGGLMVYIDHGGGLQTRYMHLATGSILVKKGDRVSAGQRIAAVGNTGITNSAAHLHFEVLENGIRIDPESVLGASRLATLLLLAGVAWVVYKVLK